MEQQPSTLCKLITVLKFYRKHVSDNLVFQISYNTSYSFCPSNQKMIKSFGQKKNDKKLEVSLKNAKLD